MQSIYKKLSVELMSIAWHPKRWQNFCMSEDEQKEIEPIFTECDQHNLSITLT